MDSNWVCFARDWSLNLTTKYMVVASFYPSNSRHVFYWIDLLRVHITHICMHAWMLHSLSSDFVFVFRHWMPDQIVWLISSLTQSQFHLIMHACMLRKQWRASFGCIHRMKLLLCLTLHGPIEITSLTWIWFSLFLFSVPSWPLHAMYYLSFYLLLS